MEDNSLYVYVVRTHGVALGVFAEEKAALAAEANFARIHSEMFPQREVPRVYLDRCEVIGGTAKGGL